MSTTALELDGRTDELVGREAELAPIESVLSSQDGPSALLFEGEAGIGKTTLWRAAFLAAGRRGCHVLRCAPGEQEAGLAFAALADLLRPTVADVLENLPKP